MNKIFIYGGLIMSHGVGRMIKVLSSKGWKALTRKVVGWDNCWCMKNDSIFG